MGSVTLRDVLESPNFLLEQCMDEIITEQNQQKYEVNKDQAVENTIAEIRGKRG